MLECWCYLLRILKKSSGLGVTHSPSCCIEVDAGQKGGEFGGGHLDAIVRGGREAEGAAFKTLCPNGHAVTIPIQDLDSIAAFIDENKEMSGEGIEGKASRCQG